MMDFNAATREIVECAFKYAPSLDPYCKKHLQHLAETNDQRPGEYFSLESKRGSFRCNTYVSFESLDKYTDEVGDTYNTYKVDVKVSWPSHGSQPLTEVKEFVELLKDCLAFAKGLKGHFSEPIVKLVETKAQREARQLEARRSATKNVVTGLVRDNCKGMRVGQERALTASVDLEPLGSVQLTVLEKQYTAHIGSMRTFYFVRTA